MRIALNGASTELVERTTVAQLLEQLKLRPQQVAVEVNCELVPRCRHAIHELSDDDKVEIVTLVGGG